MKRLILRTCCLLSMLTTTLVGTAQEDWNPVADPAAVITSGRARFTVLTPQMIRIQYSTKELFEDRATFAVVNRRLPVPDFTTEVEGNYLYIRTSALTLRYKVGGVIKATDATTNVLNITFNLNGRECTWFPAKDDKLNLLGTNRTLDGQWGDNKRESLEKGILSRGGWAIIDESPTTKRGDGSTTFAFERNEDGFDWVAQPVDKNAIDWYFMGYGHDYKRAIYDFTRVAGSVPLPPKYIFGYWYSRYWAYTATEFKQIISDMEANNIPMDVLIMDMDWHQSGWTGWSWNKSKIPDPKGLIKYMHDHNLKTALNLHPADGVKKHEDNYAAIASDCGIDPSTGEAVPWKLEDYTFYKSFFKNLMRVRESEGVDFWWLDWQQHLTSPYTEGLGETFWCNHVYFEDMRKYRPDIRPVIYHRWGGLGSHRYPICFSGDSNAAWTTLAYQIYFTSNASNVCYAYWGHDLGGHQGGNNDPELLLRWLQFGAYTPIFRTHATNDSKLERRIWKYKNFSKLREAVRMRYRMFPYLYTAARETYDTGLGMNRPLYYDWPEEPNAYLFEDEYMYGNDMLVAPIYTAAKDGYSTRNIWLPQGMWWDVTENKLTDGDRLFNARFTQDQFPVYYKAGSVIPFYPTQRSVVTNPTTITLKVVPGADGTGRFYEDAGNNQDYRTTGWANTLFTQTFTPEQTTLTIGGREGSFDGMPTKRTWEVVFLGIDAAPKAVYVNGEEQAATAYTYKEATHELTLKVTPDDLTKALTIRVEKEPSNGGTNLRSDWMWDDETGVVSIHTNGGDQLGVLSVYDVNGRLVAESRGTHASQLSVSLTGMKHGTYVCRYTCGPQVVTKKVRF